jgi:hypothetical protein
MPFAFSVIPAKAGRLLCRLPWTPAFAGVTIQWWR